MSKAASTHMTIPTPTFIKPDFIFTPILAPRFPPMKTPAPVSKISGRSRWPNAE